jgi:TRAP-type C4-dicarboxylate transport system substrate-binding protein
MPTPAMPDKPILIKFASHMPAASIPLQLGWDAWVAEVEAAAGGRDVLEIRHYDAETLAKGAEMWDATISGVTDIGWNVLAYWPGQFPLAEALALPALPTPTAEMNAATMYQIYSEFPEVQAEFTGVHMILFMSTTPYVPHTSNKQIIEIEDFKGLTLRAIGGPQQDIMAALGGTGVYFTGGEVYEAIQTGVLDGSTFPLDALQTVRACEVTKYTSYYPSTAINMAVAMNEDTWNGLPADIQEIFNELGGDYGSRFVSRNYIDKGNQAAIDWCEDNGYGQIFYQPTPEQLADWAEIAGTPIWDKWLDRQEELGQRDVAQRILDRILVIGPTK